MATQRLRAIRAEVLLLAGLVVLALLARWAGRHERTEDLRIFSDWYAELQRDGGWGGLGSEVGNYNAPFLYLLQLASIMPGALIIKIKIVWTAFDVLLAFFTFKIVALRYPGGRRRPALAAVLMMLLPTVVINASFYGQMDAMWASFALGGVYSLMKGRPWWAVSLLTVSLALKPQAVFVFPVLLLLLLADRVPWRTLLAIPLVYVALDLPAILLGRDPVELLTIYDPARQAAHVPALTSNAPSVFAFVPVDTRIDTLKNLGYVFTAALVLGICYVLVVKRLELTRARILHAAALFAILLPFTMPGMHERYFFLADVLTLVLALCRPRLWPVPLLAQAASLLSYEPFLFGRDNPLIDPMIPAALMLAALALTAYPLLTEALTTPSEPATPTAPTALTAPRDLAQASEERTRVAGQPTRGADDRGLGDGERAERGAPGNQPAGAGDSVMSRQANESPDPVPAGATAADHDGPGTSRS